MLSCWYYFDTGENIIFYLYDSQTTEKECQ